MNRLTFSTCRIDFNLMMMGSCRYIDILWDSISKPSKFDYFLSQFSYVIIVIFTFILIIILLLSLYFLQKFLLGCSYGYRFIELLCLFLVVIFFQIEDPYFYIDYQIVSFICLKRTFVVHIIYLCVLAFNFLYYIFFYLKSVFMSYLPVLFYGMIHSLITTVSSFYMCLFFIQMFSYSLCFF